MKKSFLFVVNSLELGGAEKSLVSLLTAFDYDKYDVDLLMFNPGGVFLKLVPENVRILPKLEFLKSNETIIRQLSNPKYLSARIKASVGLRRNAKSQTLHPAQCYWRYTGKYFDSLNHTYDVAVAWGQGNPTHYVADKVTANKKIAFINADYENVGHNKNFDYNYYKRFDYIAAVSDELYEKLKLVFPDFTDKLVTIYDINNAKLIRKMAMQGNPFETVKSNNILVTVGRLVSQKGYDLAIDAANILNKNNIDFKWFFVGDGVCRAELEKKINELGLNDKIILAGAKENPYVYIKNADIYVQTSKYEGFCLTLCEARILDKAIVSTSFDVVYNQLVNEENGLITEMNGEDIARAIMRLINNEELRKKLSNNLKREKKGNTEEIEKLYSLIQN